MRFVLWLTLLVSLSSKAQTLDDQFYLITAQLAFDELPAPVQTYYEKGASALFNSLSKNHQVLLTSKYRGFSRFALVSTLPNHFQNWRVTRMYELTNQTMPTQFKEHSHTNSRVWRYSYIDIQQKCEQPRGGNSTEAFQQHLKSFIDSKNEAQRPMLTSFINALVVDLHQPTQTHAKFNIHCRPKLTGISTCLNRHTKGHCLETLATHWHRGFDQYTINAKDGLPLVTNTQAKNSNKMKPSHWLAENKKIAQYLLSIPKEKALNEQHQAKLEVLFNTRLHQSSKRLANVLKSLWKQTQ